MRDHPACVDRVPGEPAAELVVHAAAGHRLAGALGQPQRVRVPGPLMVAEQEFQHHRRRELRRAAEPAVGGVVIAVERLHRRVRGLAEPGTRLGLPGRACFALAHLTQRAGGGRRVLGQGRGDLLGLAGHAVALGAPGPRDVQDQLLEVVPGKVGAAEERLLVRRHEHRHRPAALPGHGLGRGHVDRVHVGPLLPVHLDRDHVRVDQRRRLGVLERLVGHHVTPVTGGVAHREQDGDVTLGGLGEGLVAPRPPVHRVVRMLEQVGTRRIPQPVHSPYATRAGGTTPRTPRCASRPGCGARRSIARPEGLCLLPEPTQGPLAGRVIAATPRDAGYAAGGAVATGLAVAAGVAVLARRRRIAA